MLMCMDQGGTGHAGKRLGEADHPGPDIDDLSEVCVPEVHVPLFMWYSFFI